MVKENQQLILENVLSFKGKVTQQQIEEVLGGRSYDNV